ncbi:hypothetical protein V8F20_006158 [Naviculisporaceae sp. PSN 640]
MPLFRSHPINIFCYGICYIDTHQLFRPRESFYCHFLEHAIGLCISSLGLGVWVVYFLGVSRPGIRRPDG